MARLRQFEFCWIAVRPVISSCFYTEPCASRSSPHRVFRFFTGALDSGIVDDPSNSVECPFVAASFGH
jgi:hypothetical protein